MRVFNRLAPAGPTSTGPMGNTRIAVLTSVAIVAIIAIGGVVVWQHSAAQQLPLAAVAAPPQTAPSAIPTISASSEPVQPVRIGYVTLSEQDPVIAGFINRSAPCAMGTFDLDVAGAFNAVATEVHKHGYELSYQIASVPFGSLSGIRVVEVMVGPEGPHERAYYYALENGQYIYLRAEPTNRPDPLSYREMQYTCTYANNARAAAGLPSAFANASSVTRGSTTYKGPPAREPEPPAPTAAETLEAMGLDSVPIDHIGAGVDRTVPRFTF